MVFLQRFLRHPYFHVYSVARAFYGVKRALARAGGEFGTERDRVPERLGRTIEEEVDLSG